MQDSIDDGLHHGNTLINAEEVKGYLITTAKWGRFLSILGFIGIGLMVLFSLGALTDISSYSDDFSDLGIPFGTGIFVLFYLLIALLYFLPTWYLYNFSIKIIRGYQNESSADMTEAFAKLKSLFKFVGIMTIIIVSIYILAFFTAIGIGSMA